MGQQKPKIGVIGVGGMGARHAHNLATMVADAELSALMDVDRDRLAAIARDTGARPFTDGHALIRDDDVDAVVIASSDPTHADLALACLAAEKPVLCEKPLATDLAEAAAVVQAEATLGRRLIQLGFMRVFDLAHQDVKSLLDTGDLGRPLMFRGVHNNHHFGRERTAEEVATNSAVHDFHSAEWLMEDDVATITARHVPAVEDRPASCRLLLIQLTFERGGLGTIEVNADSGYGYEVSVEMTCEHGIVTSAEAATPMVKRAGQRSAAIAPDWLVRFDLAYLAEIRAWVEALRQGMTIGPSAWDGYRSLVLAEATMRSIETGQPVSPQGMTRPALYGR